MIAIYSSSDRSAQRTSYSQSFSMLIRSATLHRTICSVAKKAAKFEVFSLYNTRRIDYTFSRGWGNVVKCPPINLWASVANWPDLARVQTGGPLVPSIVLAYIPEGTNCLLPPPPPTPSLSLSLDRGGALYDESTTLLAISQVSQRYLLRRNLDGAFGKKRLADLVATLNKIWTSSDRQQVSILHIIIQHNSQIVSMDPKLVHTRSSSFIRCV